MDTIKDYIEKNRNRFLDELFELLKIPSISAKSEHKKDIISCAELLKSHLEKQNFDNCEICETNGHPIVYGEKIVDDKLPTVLVYGHYDVQPIDPIELWDSAPFEPQLWQLSGRTGSGCPKEMPSHQWGSNPRPYAYEAHALPLSYRGT